MLDYDYDYDPAPSTLVGYKHYAIDIAKQFYYPDSIIDRIENAKSITQVANIMHDARNAED